MFMAIYAVLIVGIFGGGVLGYVQWFLGQTAWAFLLVPIGILMIGLLHVASLIGQRLSSDQMRILRDRLDQVLDSSRASDGDAS